MEYYSRRSTKTSKIGLLLLNTILDPNTPPVYVAIIDDEVDLAYLFRAALSQIAGVEVFSFTNPHLALEHFQINHQNYRVVISDYRMHEMTGIQLLERMKEINPTVKKMLVSAFEIEDELFE